MEKIQSTKKKQEEAPINKKLEKKKKKRQINLFSYAYFNLLKSGKII